MLRFDGYSATTTEANHYQLADLFGPGLTPSEGRGFHQFGHRLGLKDETGIEVGAVMWGGGQGERTFIEVKGERSPEVVEALRSRFSHRATRLDSCADFDAPGAFDSLLGSCMAVKQRHRLKGERHGDWQDFPELGRTQYLGSPQSVTRLRLYEKGKQREYEHLARPDWVRAELQVRPAKEAKTAFSSLSASEVWGASGWSRDLAGEILANHVDPHPAGTTWRKSDLEVKLTWACKQYGATFVELVEQLGSWECLGLTLREKIAELKEGEASQR
jgi:DNA relaxase NicK